jgi:SAM-dependent methyltransferase
MDLDPLKPEFWKSYARRLKEEKDQRFLRPDFWDRLSDRYDELEESPFYQKMVEEIVSTLRERGALSPEKRVFDVACGPGNYALRFAPLVKEVVGLDISPKMLARFREKFAAAGFSNYRLIQADWFSYQTKEQYETVFVSMSPILHDLDSIDRLLELATHFLALVHWAGVRENELHQRLYQEVFGRQWRWQKPGLIVPFNYLYSLGLAGDLRFFCGYWERKRTLEKELEHFLWRLDGEGISPSVSEKEKIRAILAQEADDQGYILSRTKVRIGFLLLELQGPCGRTR